jgi:hypothetical protein
VPVDEVLFASVSTGEIQLGFGSGRSSMGTLGIAVLGIVFVVLLGLLLFAPLPIVLTRTASAAFSSWRGRHFVGQPGRLG